MQTHSLADPITVSMTGLSRSTLYRQASAGRLKMLKFGRSTLVDYASLRALLDSLPPADLKAAI
jgi:excisionase family DNA binding protein